MSSTNTNDLGGPRVAGVAATTGVSAVVLSTAAFVQQVRDNGVVRGEREARGRSWTMSGIGFANDAPSWDGRFGISRNVRA